MVMGTRGRKWALLGLALVAGILMFAPGAFAAEEEAAKAAGDVSVGEGLRAIGIALGACIAIVGSGMATAKAQAAVGAGGTGALAEKPELFGRIFLLFAVPETIVILGFVIAFFLYGAL